MRKPTLKCSACGGPMWQGTGAKSDGTQKCRPCRRKERESGVKTCVDCNGQFKWRDAPRCSPCNTARAKAKAVELGRQCTECGDPATHSGRCQRCHMKRVNADPVRKAQKRARDQGRKRQGQSFTKQCEFCNETFTNFDYRGKYCSHACAIRSIAGYSPSKELVLYRSVERQARMWVGHTIPARNGNPLVMGACAWCGESFVGPHRGTYCSKRCATNASWKRRYDARGEFKVSDRMRQGIYERDNWTCQLCGKPVSKDVGAHNKLSPTLDHIIPQSLQLIPDHSESNLRLAHLICNAKRGNRMEYDLTV